jgi:hypothetical protein
MGSDDPGRDRLVAGGRVVDALDSEAGVVVGTTTRYAKLNKNREREITCLFK